MYIYLQNQDGLSFAITVRKTIICIYKIYKIIIKREHSVRTDV